MIIKVCGMREADNIRAVEALGADWMGFIFHPRSPRFVDQRPAYLPSRCRRVGVFVNATPDSIADHVSRYGLGGVQLHGDETPLFCRTLRPMLPPDCRIVKAIGAGSPADIDRALSYTTADCDYLLFDTACATHGGSGTAFDWSVLARYPEHDAVPFLLSGGIGPQSLPALLTLHHPLWAGVDLNSRFELSPGRKDTAALAPFISAIRKLTSLPTNTPTQ